MDTQVFNPTFASAYQARLDWQGFCEAVKIPAAYQRHLKSDSPSFTTSFPEFTAVSKKSQPEVVSEVITVQEPVKKPIIRYSEVVLRTIRNQLQPVEPPEHLKALTEIFVPLPKKRHFCVNKGVDRETKRTVCLDWLQGKCDARRWKCKFVHPAAEGSPIATEKDEPDCQVETKEEEKVPPPPPSDASTTVCSVWRLTGTCKFGSFCWYMHPALDSDKELLKNPHADAKPKEVVETDKTSKEKKKKAAKNKKNKAKRTTRRKKAKAKAKAKNPP